MRADWVDVAGVRGWCARAGSGLLQSMGVRAGRVGVVAAGGRVESHSRGRCSRRACGMAQSGSVQPERVRAGESWSQWPVGVCAGQFGIAAAGGRARGSTRGCCSQRACARIDSWLLQPEGVRDGRVGVTTAGGRARGPGRGRCSRRACARAESGSLQPEGVWNGTVGVGAAGARARGRVVVAVAGGRVRRSVRDRCSRRACARTGSTSLFQQRGRCGSVANPYPPYSSVCLNHCFHHIFISFLHINRTLMTAESDSVAMATVKLCLFSITYTPDFSLNP